MFALGDKDLDDIFDEFDEEALSDLPENVAVKPVSTDLEVGAEFTLSIEPKNTDEREKRFLPTVAGKKCFIPFLFGNNTDAIAGNKSSGGEGEAVAEAIMLSAKCRILISKRVIPEIEAAYFEGRGGQNYSVALFDYGEFWCAEIPFILLMDEPKYKFDRLVVLKK